MSLSLLFMSKALTDQTVLIASIIKSQLQKINTTQNYYTNAGYEVYFLKQWFDFNNLVLPAVNFFILEESLIENKGCSYKQELTLKIETFVSDKNENEIYLSIADVKQALLSNKDDLNIQYLGYELNLPEEGSRIISAHMHFKILYVENIKGS